MAVKVALFTQMILNKNLRIKIAKIVKSSGEGHIPSCFSIVDVINFLYENILTFKSKQPKWPDRDYFILSKGHGAGALTIYIPPPGCSFRASSEATPATAIGVH